MAVSKCCTPFRNSWEAAVAPVWSSWEAAVAPFWRSRFANSARRSNSCKFFPTPSSFLSHRKYSTANEPAIMAVPRIVSCTLLFLLLLLLEAPLSLSGRDPAQVAMFRPRYGWSRVAASLVVNTVAGLHCRLEVASIRISANLLPLWAVTVLCIQDIARRTTDKLEFKTRG